MSEQERFEWWLARQATPHTRMIWDLRTKYRMERELWVCVMRVQHDLGVSIPALAIRDYQARTQFIDLESIRQRELSTRHDVKARLEEFNALAGHQFAHLGMTGRDLDDNIELAQVKRSLDYLADRMRERHESSLAHELQGEADRLPLRGIWGPVGTGQDQLDLLGGDLDRLQKLNRWVAVHLGFDPRRVLRSVGQVYPRSIDHGVAATVIRAVTPAIGGRTEWASLLRGYYQMLAQLSGDQWLEGDVSCSVVRRVALPGLFLAADAALGPRTPPAPSEAHGGHGRPHDDPADKEIPDA